MVSLREELIQVAAVAVAIVQDLDDGTTALVKSDVEVVLQQVEYERQRQEEKWGPQHHSTAEWLAILTEEVGEAVRCIKGADREPMLSDWGNMWWSLTQAEFSAREFLKLRFGSVMA